LQTAYFVLSSLVCSSKWIKTQGLNLIFIMAFFILMKFSSADPDDPIHINSANKADIGESNKILFALVTNSANKTKLGRW